MFKGLVMKKKVVDLQEARQEKRDNSGWSIEEIRKRAAEEREAFKALAEKEPDSLASGGDMKNILKEEEHDEE